MLDGGYPEREGRQNPVQLGIRADARGLTAETRRRLFSWGFTSGSGRCR
jgi:hypothetical protein